MDASNPQHLLQGGAQSWDAYGDPGLWDEVCSQLRALTLQGVPPQQPIGVPYAFFAALVHRIQRAESEIASLKEEIEAKAAPSGLDLSGLTDFDPPADPRPEPPETSE